MPPTVAAKGSTSRTIEAAALTCKCRRPYDQELIDGRTFMRSGVPISHRDNRCRPGVSGQATDYRSASELTVSPDQKGESSRRTVMASRSPSETILSIDTFRPPT